MSFLLHFLLLSCWEGGLINAVIGIWWPAMANPPQLCKAWLCLLDELLIGASWLLFDSHKILPSPRWTNSVPSASPHRTSATALNHHGGPPLTLLQFVNSFAATGAQNWVHHFRCGLNLDPDQQLIITPSFTWQIDVPHTTFFFSRKYRKLRQKITWYDYRYLRYRCLIKNISFVPFFLQVPSLRHPELHLDIF